MAENKKIRIMTYGDDPYTSTGYGQIWFNMLKEWTKLKPEWEFYHVSWQSKQRAHKTPLGYTHLPFMKEPYGFDTILPYVMEYQPDIVITLCDIGLHGGYLTGLMEARKRGWKGKWIAYSPVDTKSWAASWDSILGFPDINVADAEFGKEQMIKNKVPNVKCIPHGVDINIFKPSENKEECKREYRLGGNFVLGFVGRNQWRKMQAYLIKGFAQFSKGKDDVKLLMHTDRRPTPVGNAQQGWNIDDLLYIYEKLYDPELSAKQKVMLTNDNLDIDLRQKVSNEDMNKTYNLMDLFCYATGGEGFGMPGLECQASGTPLFMTDCTTAKELTGNEENGVLIKVLKDEYGREVVSIGGNGIENYLPDDVHIAELLEEYYQDWKKENKKLTELSKKSRRFAEKYSWDKINSAWIKLLEDEL